MTIQQISPERRIETMLQALLANHLHWVGSYAHGRTSNGDPFLVLYPASDKLAFQVCRVYEHDFGKLPAYVDTAVDENAPDNIGNKDKAGRLGWLVPCAPFQVVTYDGRETQMGPEKRFGGVIRISRAGLQWEPGTTAETAPQKLAAPAPSPREAATAVNGGHALPDYAEMARSARTASDFDYNACMALPAFAEVEHVTYVRVRIDQVWNPARAEAMFTAVAKYGSTRADLPAHMPKAEAHAKAMDRAQLAYAEAVTQ